ncbi:MAG TPA: hypothetical protein VHG93_27440 [Longimicrobium sp.]|nr:hypothetical protein [Longimicrobium sp.]
MRIVALGLIAFGVYALSVHGTAARGSCAGTGFGTRVDRGTDAMLRFCTMAGQETQPWRGRVLRGAWRSLLMGLPPFAGGCALLALSGLIELY